MLSSLPWHLCEATGLHGHHVKTCVLECPLFQVQRNLGHALFHHYLRCRETQGCLDQEPTHPCPCKRTETPRACSGAAWAPSELLSIHPWFIYLFPAEAEEQRKTRAEQAEGQAAAAAGSEALPSERGVPCPCCRHSRAEGQKESSYPQTAKSSVTCLTWYGLLRPTLRFSKGTVSQRYSWQSVRPTSVWMHMCSMDGRTQSRQTELELVTVVTRARLQLCIRAERVLSYSASEINETFWGISLQTVSMGPVASQRCRDKEANNHTYAASHLQLPDGFPLNCFASADIPAGQDEVLHASPCGSSLLQESRHKVNNRLSKLLSQPCPPTQPLLYLVKPGNLGYPAKENYWKD